MLYNFFRSMRLFQFLGFAILWIVVGFLFLPLYVLRDVSYLIKIFCSYNDENDHHHQKEFEDLRQDKIMIYNELIDVMKASLFYAKAHRKKNAPHDLNAVEFEEQDESERYELDKELIIEAWKRYRPNDAHPIVQEEQPIVHNTNKNFKTVVGQMFINRLIENINKNSQQVEMEDDDGSAGSSEGDKSMIEDEIPKIELAITEEFLKRFTLGSDASQNEVINLQLALRALPKRVNEHNEAKINLLNFAVIRMSLIGFQNDDKDELFNYYDQQNFKRLYKLRKNFCNNNLFIKLNLFSL